MDQFFVIRVVPASIKNRVIRGEEKLQNNCEDISSVLSGMDLYL